MCAESWDYLHHQPPPSTFLAGFPEIIIEVEKVKWIFPVPLLAPAKLLQAGEWGMGILSELLSCTVGNGWRFDQP